MPRRDPTKEKYWRRLLDLWRRSGLTGRDFCGEHHLSAASFYAWRREIAHRDRQAATRNRRLASTMASVPGELSAAITPAFIKLAIDGGAATSPHIDVIVAAGRRLRISPGFDADLFRQLLRLLEEARC